MLIGRIVLAEPPGEYQIDGCLKIAIHDGQSSGSQLIVHDAGDFFHGGNLACQQRRRRVRWRWYRQRSRLLILLLLLWKAGGGGRPRGIGR